MGLPKVDFEWDFAKPIPEDQKKRIEESAEMLSKNGITSTLHPSLNMTKKEYYEQLREDLLAGRCNITDFHGDGISFTEFKEKVLNGDFDEL